MKSITIALRTDGKADLLHGPEVPFATQRNTVQKFRDTDVPEGVERVEIWTRGMPAKFACKKTPEALKAQAERAAAEKAVADKQAEKEAAAKKAAEAAATPPAK